MSDKAGKESWKDLECLDNDVRLHCAGSHNLVIPGLAPCFISLASFPPMPNLSAILLQSGLL